MRERDDESGLDDPMAMRQGIREIREFAEAQLRQDVEESFGLSQDVLLTKPAVLQSFLDHVDPTVRADAIHFVGRHMNTLARQFAGFPYYCVRTARGAAAELEVRRAAIMALGSLYGHMGDPAFLVELAEFACDTQLDMLLRDTAYVSLVQAPELVAAPGHLGAFLDLKFIIMKQRHISRKEMEFVRVLIEALCPPGTTRFSAAEGGPP